jgi:hypothetical protein
LAKPSHSTLSASTESVGEGGRRPKLSPRRQMGTADRHSSDMSSSGRAKPSRPVVPAPRAPTRSSDRGPSPSVPPNANLTMQKYALIEDSSDSEM